MRNASLIFLLLFSSSSLFAQLGQKNSFRIGGGVTTPINTFKKTNATGGGIEGSYERRTDRHFTFNSAIGLDVMSGGESYTIVNGPVTTFISPVVANIGYVQTGIRFYPVRNFYAGISIGYAGIAGCGNDSLRFRDCDNSSAGWLHTLAIGYQYKRLQIQADYKNIARRKGDDYDYLSFKFGYLIKRR